MGDITTYTNRFSHLHTATSRKSWTNATRYKAPNKPLLLLTIIDLFAQGSIIDNLIEPSEELGDLFLRYWSHVMPPERRGNLAMPFFHMRHEGFWRLMPRPGQEAVLAATKTMTSMNQVRDVLLGARLDTELFDLLCTEAGRGQLRTGLIETYFAPELRPRLIEQSSTNLAAYLYSKYYSINYCRIISCFMLEGCRIDLLEEGHFSGAQRWHLSLQKHGMQQSKRTCGIFMTPCPKKNSGALRPCRHGNWGMAA